MERCRERRRSAPEEGAEGLEFKSSRRDHLLLFAFNMYLIWYTVSVGKKPKSTPRAGAHPEWLERQGKRVPAIFYRTEAGGEPVRDWLKELSSEDRKRIGEDIKTVEFGWPVGMPVCKPLGDGIYEVRTTLAQNRIARMLFYIDKKGRMVLLHGFVKKTQKTADEDLDLARRNKNKHRRGLQ
jgi:phage-related protein